MPVEPCHRCGNPTNRWCGTLPCCWSCHTAKYPTHVHRGSPGRARADHGPDQFDLACVACGATWVGSAWEPCDWCRWAAEVVIPKPSPVEYVAGWLRCDDCGALRRISAGYFDLCVHGAHDTDSRSCNGRMRRITVTEAARLLREAQ